MPFTIGILLSLSYIIYSTGLDYKGCHIAIANENAHPQANECDL